MKRQGCAFFLFAFLLSCESNRLVYRLDVPPPSYYSETHRISEIRQGKMDAIVSIDNSGSMDHFQKKVRENSNYFMEGLAYEGIGVDWKLGLLSTDITDAPYLGFDIPFNYSQDNVVETFNEAVVDLGIEGGIPERAFSSVLKALNGYPSFLREDAFLVLFFLTDEREQSDEPYNGKSLPTAQDFIEQLIKIKGKEENILVYGAFAFKDLEGEVCQNGDWTDQGIYEESRFREVIEYFGKNKSSGKDKHFSACSDKFGEKFVEVAADISETIFEPRVVTEYRFLPDSVKVDIGGVEIEVGEREDAPYWVYDESSNVIKFSNLEFLGEDVGEFVNIFYQVDDGYEYIRKPTI
ncbi:MAG: hypothetical protein OXB84_00925 [Halobacteriovoraceae bacterium]|nr:hypothetical protein [Halobacteriovoraceae bacterium]